MENLKRRDVIKGIAGISLIGAGSQMGFSRSSGMSGVKNGRMAEENFALMPAVAPEQLNVVLHRVVAILFDYKRPPHALTVLVPHVGGHVYGAGPWTIENGL